MGFRNEQIQKKLLSNPGLKYKKAFETTVAIETKQNDSVELQSKHLQLAGVKKINTH